VVEGLLLALCMFFASLDLIWTQMWTVDERRCCFLSSLLISLDQSTSAMQMCVVVELSPSRECLSWPLCRSVRCLCFWNSLRRSVLFCPLFSFCLLHLQNEHRKRHIFSSEIWSNVCWLVFSVTIEPSDEVRQVGWRRILVFSFCEIWKDTNIYVMCACSSTWRCKIVNWDNGVVRSGRNG